MRTSPAQSDPAPAALPALLWSVSLGSGAILGWECWARLHRPEWSLTWLITSDAGRIRIDPVNPIHGLGRWLGVMGSVCLCATLAYVPFKRIPLLQRWMPLSTSLDLHAFLGMMGAVFAAYHTTFGVVGSNVFIWVFWACMAAVATGIAARHSYVPLPRTRGAATWLALHIVASLLMFAMLAFHVWVEISVVGWT